MLKEEENDISSGSSDERLSSNHRHQEKCQTQKQSIDSDDEADTPGPRREHSVMLAKTKNRKLFFEQCFILTLSHAFDQL